MSAGAAMRATSDGLPELLPREQEAERVRRNRQVSQTHLYGRVAQSASFRLDLASIFRDLGLGYVTSTF